MTVEVREADGDDWSSIWPIFSEIVRAGDTYAYDTATDEDQARAIWLDAPRKTYVVEDDDKVLGTYYIKTNQAGPGSHVCNCGYMVSSKARGRGLATIMCEHSQQIAVTLGYKAMQFNFVVSSNEHAVSLWTKLGFDIVGRVPRAFDHPSLGLVDAFVMFKWLGRSS